MDKNQTSQIILVNKSLSDNSVQIVIPPFRAISMYEIEDNFDNIIMEIKDNIHDEQLQKHIVGFVSAFKESIDTADVFPIAEYFINSSSGQSEPAEMIQMFQLLKEFIEQASDKHRLMH